MNSPSVAVPLPLPADVDLSGMEHMPLFDERLRKSRSWLRAKNWRGDGPGLGFCLFNLWARAFRELPAGSIEDDDDVMAEAAQCDIAHWAAMKDKALIGWQWIPLSPTAALHEAPPAGRWHHPVVSQIAWDLWRARLEKRYELNHLSWKAACKRALDAGREPPDSPGTVADWLARTYPATAAYLATLDRAGAAVAATHEPDGTDSRADNGGNASDKRPKRSKGKDIPPCSPPTPPDRADGRKGLGKGQGTTPSKAGKQWFAGEEARLKGAFGNAWPMLASAAAGAIERTGRSPAGAMRFNLVNVFKGCHVAFEKGQPTILFPSKRRADGFAADAGALMAEHLPEWRWRPARVDELRMFKSVTPEGSRNGA